MHIAPLRALAILVALLSTARGQEFGSSPQGGFRQQPGAIDVSGTWSGQANGPDGARRGTDGYGRDGTYASVIQLPNGTMMRAWGTYTATPMAQNQVRMDFHVRGWLPRQICPPAGFNAPCIANELPQESSFVYSFLSPSSFEFNGIRMDRDPVAALLQQQVPERLVMAMPPQGQVNGQMQTGPTMPVMPTLHPYVTPNGPGQAIANGNHENAQNFINGYMRGCSKDSRGRLYGCEQ